MQPLHRPACVQAWLDHKEKRFVDSIMSQVEKSQCGGCWLWTGSKDDFGYGRIRVGKAAPRLHRLFYEMFKGPIPGDKLVLHNCDVPACVNPDHLRLGTMLDNARDRDSRGRSGTIGEKNPKAKLTEDQVREIRRRWTGEYGQASALMREYGIKAPAFYRIVRGQAWKHVV